LSSRKWDRSLAARELDDHTSEKLQELRLPAPSLFLKELRAYLQALTDSRELRKGGVNLPRLNPSPVDFPGCQQIDAGPRLFKSASPEPAIELSSGAKVSLGVTLRPMDTRGSQLVAYRFHLELPHPGIIQYLGIDLNAPKGTYDPLHQPRSHMHPGDHRVHVPYPVMHPLAILDRLIHVVAPSFSA
jgi:hypothetical protein